MARHAIIISMLLTSLGYAHPGWENVNHVLFTGQWRVAANSEFAVAQSGNYLRIFAIDSTSGDLQYLNYFLFSMDVVDIQMHPSLPRLFVVYELPGSDIIRPILQIDLTDPMNPGEVWTWHPDPDRPVCFGFLVHEENLFVLFGPWGGGGDRHLQSFDISDPDEPLLLIDTPIWNNANNLAVDNGLLHLGGGPWGSVGLHTYGVGNFNSMQPPDTTDWIKTSYWLIGIGGIHSILSNDSFTSSHTSVYSYANPYAITAVQGIPNFHTSACQYYGGNIFYINGGYGAGTYGIYRLNVGAVPVMRLPGLIFDFQLVDDRMMVASSEALQHFDVSSGTLVLLDEVVPLIDGINQIAIENGLMVITGGEGGNVLILSLEDPVNPDVLASINVGAETGDICIDSGIIYLGAEPDCLVIIDAQDPLNPEILSYYALTGHNPGYITYLNQKVYFSSEGDLLAIDVDNPSSPMLQEVFSIPGSELGQLCVVSSFLAAKEGYYGPETYILSTEPNLALASVINQTSYAAIGMASQDSLLALFGANLWLYKVIDPTTPELVCVSLGHEDCYYATRGALGGNIIVAPIQGFPHLSNFSLMAYGITEDYSNIRPLGFTPIPENGNWCEVKIFGDYVYLAEGYNLGIYALRDSASAPIVPVTEIPMNDPVCNSSTILGNYPNPFNPQTTIGYQLPTNSFVNLQIYDTAGRLVATLLNSWREAGSHQAIWDASGLPSGLYFCRIEAGDFSAVQKMMLIK